MPIRVGGEQVGIAACVVVVVAVEHGPDQVCDPGIVDKRAKNPVAVYKLLDIRILPVVVGAAVMATALGGENRLESVDETANLSGEQVVQMQVAEYFEMPELLLGECYGNLFLPGFSRCAID